jgi:hypothetical protein
MKDIQTLQRLANNPYYKMSDAEKQALSDFENKKPESHVPKGSKTVEVTQLTEIETVADDPKGKSNGKVSSKGNAAAKETGKLNKHSSDPVSE